MFCRVRHLIIYRGTQVYAVKLFRAAANIYTVVCMCARVYIFSLFFFRRFTDLKQYSDEMNTVIAQLLRVRAVSTKDTHIL